MQGRILRVILDTSVWVHHFKHGDAVVQQLLIDGAVLLHPYVLTEIALGGVKNPEIVRLLQLLPVCSIVDQSELRSFIGIHRLVGAGIGLVDTAILASAMLVGAKIWTRDKRLTAASRKLNCAFEGVGI